MSTLRLGITFNLTLNNVKENLREKEKENKN